MLKYGCLPTELCEHRGSVHDRNWITHCLNESEQTLPLYIHLWKTAYTWNHLLNHCLLDQLDLCLPAQVVSLICQLALCLSKLTLYAHTTFFIRSTLCTFNVHDYCYCNFNMSSYLQWPMISCSCHGWHYTHHLHHTHKFASSTSSYIHECKTSRHQVPQEHFYLCQRTLWQHKRWHT